MTATAEVLNQFAAQPYPGTIAPAPALRPGRSVCFLRESEQLTSKNCREEELVGAAVYLASSAGGFCYGSVLLLDGGWAAVNP